MYTLRVGLALFTFTCILGTLMAQSAGVFSDDFNLEHEVSGNISTKVVVDDQGDIHILWTVPAGNGSVTTPGIWYGRYAANGTRTVPPKLIRNSSSVQSADMDVDRLQNAHITWVEGPAFGNQTGTDIPDYVRSKLYYLQLNSTDSSEIAPTEVTESGGIVAWPSLVVDDNLTGHLVWAQLDRTGTTKSGTYYGTMNVGNTINRTFLIGEYSRSIRSIPRPRAALDDSSGLHVVWAERDQFSTNRLISTITYVRIDLKRNNITHLEVAESEDAIQEVTITPASGGTAYVVWQPAVGHDSFYVSQISSTGKVVFLRKIARPISESAGQAYFSVSADSHDSLYVVWYQPPAVPLGHSGSISTSLASISYVKLEEDGTLSQTASEVVAGPLIAVTVSKTGDIYAISPRGIVKIGAPVGGLNIPILLLAFAIASVLGAGAATEEGRYRMLCSIAYLSGRRETAIAPEQNRLLRLMCRRPGLRYRDIKALMPKHPPSFRKLAALEKSGVLSSMRDGLTRRFYVSASESSARSLSLVLPDAIPTRILTEIERTPGIWEAKLARDLGLSQQIVNYHLRGLVRAKLIAVQIRGKRKHYALARSAWKPQRSYS